MRSVVAVVLLLMLAGCSTQHGTAAVSPAPASPSPTSRIAAQCSGLSAALSDIASAENGYPNGPLDAAGWRGLMASAGQKLAAVDDSGALGTQVTVLVGWYGRDDLDPSERPGTQVIEARQAVNELCRDNGTPLVIVSQYGG